VILRCYCKHFCNNCILWHNPCNKMVSYKYLFILI